MSPCPAKAISIILAGDKLTPYQPIATIMTLTFKTLKLALDLKVVYFQTINVVNAICTDSVFNGKF